jgi:hypothetical protein
LLQSNDIKNLVDYISKLPPTGQAGTNINPFRSDNDDSSPD